MHDCKIFVHGELLEYKFSRLAFRFSLALLVNLFVCLVAEASIGAPKVDRASQGGKGGLAYTVTEPLQNKMRSNP